MLSALFTSVADSLISYAIDKLDPAEKVKSWLKLEPAQLAFEKAFARGYAAFARQYPEYVANLFNDSFLKKEALSELSKLLTRNQHPDPALLAQAWGQSINADADFAQAATKPASYFIERLEAELKAEPALQALFDSRALDSLPKIEAEIQKLTSDLQRGLDTALKAANDYQKVTLHIEGDVKDSNIIVGDNNVINKYYYSGDFVSLNEYYIPPDGVFQRVRVDEFVGRDWLTAKVDAFLNDPNQKSGAFLLVGDAGVGKTAFMAHLVKERRYLHLFAEQVPGQAMLQRALQSLGSQLVTRYQIDPYKDRDTLNVLAGFPDFLERLLRLAASTLTEGEKIVIVYDALDEAGVFPDHFVFGLPKELPDGVYLILSQRPVNTKLPNFEPLRFDLEAQSEDNLQDMEAYLSAVAKRPTVAGQIHAKDYSEDFFIQTLKEKSLGVWMYLHYVIKEIERGQRAPLDLESLPKGFVGYYADYWDNWRSGRKGSDATKWDSLYAPLLTTLAAAQEAITVDKLIEWAGVQANPNEVTRLLSESWSSFITEKEEKGRIVYTLYHQSLRDFITGKVEDIKKLPPTYASLVNNLSKKKVEAHQRIVNAFEAECNSEWEKLVEQDYPRLHLTAHLNDAGEYEKLRIFLTEGDEKIKWAEAREKKEETYAGYLTDLTYVWNYAEREQNYALAIRCMLIENSIHSLALNIPSELLVELAKAGLWSYSRCLSIIRQKSISGDLVTSLQLIIPDLPLLLIPEALSIASEIEGEADRASALTALVPYLNNERRIQTLQEVLSIASEIEDEFDRASALTALVPYINIELQPHMLFSIREIEDKYERARLLATFALHLDDLQRTQVIQEALSTAFEIKDEYSHASTLAYMAICLGGRLSTQLVQEALSIARKIKDDSDRANVLAILAPLFDGKIKMKILQEAHSAACKIMSKRFRASALTALVPHLESELKNQVLKEAFSTACEITDESTRALCLSELIPHLNDDLKEQTLSATREIAEEAFRISVLCALIPTLKEDLYEQFLSAGREINNAYFRAITLTALVSQYNGKLRNQVLQEALSAAYKIQKEYINTRANVLAALAPLFEGELRTRVLQEALTSSLENQDDLFARGLVLTILAPYINDGSKTQVLKEALFFAYRIEDETARVRILSSLVPQLNDDHTESVLQETLSAIDKIQNESNRASALASLASNLNEELKKQVLQEALFVVCKMKDTYDLVSALAALVPHFTVEQKAQALSFAREIKNENISSCALIILLPHFNNELKSQVLSAVLEIKDEYDRAHALAALIPYLNDALKMQALFAGREIKDKYYRANVLIALVPFLNSETQVALLQELLHISDNNLLQKVLNTWKVIEFTGLKENIKTFIKFVSHKNRSDGLRVVYALTPALVHFSGEEIAPELYRAITDVTRWWP